MERHVLHLDVTAFAVAVERVVEPRLRGRPVVVAPPHAPRALVRAVSVEARRWGIAPGTPLAQARRACRELVVLAPNERLYARASRAVFRVLADFAPVVEPAGDGDAYLDLTGTGRLLGPPVDVAERLRREMRARLRLGPTLGLAANKLVSRVAGETSRPEGLCRVSPGGERGFFAPLPVGLLPGVAEDVRERLLEFNVRLLGELAVVSAGHLTMAFGSLGPVLHQRARGVDFSPVRPPERRPAVAEELTLPDDTNDPEELAAYLFALAERAGARLRGLGALAGEVAVEAHYSDYRQTRRHARLGQPADDNHALFEAARVLLESALTRRVRVRHLRLVLRRLGRRPRQLELFAAPKPQKHGELPAALDRIRTRYGEGAVRFGRTVGRTVGRTGGAPALAPPAGEPGSGRPRAPSPGHTMIPLPGRAAGTRETASSVPSRPASLRGEASPGSGHPMASKLERSMVVEAAHPAGTRGAKARGQRGPGTPLTPISARDVQNHAPRGDVLPRVARP